MEILFVFVSTCLIHLLEEALIGYVYAEGDKEVDRLASAFGGVRRSDAQLRRDDEAHRAIGADIERANAAFEQLASDNGRLAAAGRCAARIGWRQLPKEAKKRLQADDVR